MILAGKYEVLYCSLLILIYISPYRIRFSYILLWFWENGITEWNLPQRSHIYKGILYAD